MYRNELIEMNRVRLVFLLVDLDAAEITPAVGLDTEINCPSAALALFLGFRLISSELDLAAVLITAMRTLNGLLDDHGPSSYSSSRNQQSPAKHVCPASFIEEAVGCRATESFMSNVFSVTTVLLMKKILASDSGFSIAD